MTTLQAVAPSSSTLQRLETGLQQLGVGADDLAKAKTFQSRQGGRLEQILANMGSLLPAQLARLYAELTQRPLLDDAAISAWQPDATLLARFVPLQLDRYGWLPYAQTDEAVLFAVTDPYHLEAIDTLERLALGYDILLLSNDQFELLQQKARPSTAVALDSLSSAEESRLKELASEAPTVNLLNALLNKSVTLRASDLHIEPFHGRFRARVRVDGVMQELEVLGATSAWPLITRIKLLAGMNIAEHRRPQDGKLTTRAAGRDFDVRVSCLPLGEGESVVMRFLAKDSLSLDIATLGYSPDVAAELGEDLKRTAGVILLTGPTGSGKTTSLYSFLARLNTAEVKIITLEDPVEYQLPGIAQVQVRPEIGFNFANGLRSIVRQDPDVIMLGEIRDGETAAIAMQSSLTGHLVFSTVHTNDAASAFTRLLDLGVEEYLLNAALISIVAQRLARRLCNACSVPDPDALETLQRLGYGDLTPLRISHADFRKPVGCQACNGIGYRGRIALVEYLRCDEGIRAMPKHGDFVDRARAYNRSQGRRSLLEDGIHRAALGDTALAEALRVAG